MSANLNRREFLKKTAVLAAAGTAALGSRAAFSAAEPLYTISLAQWSLNPLLFGGQLDNLDFAKTARSLGIEAIEYVNQFFFDKAKDQAYLREMKNRAEGEGVTSVLIMCDREGSLGDPDSAKRTQAVENHYKWVDAAKFLGCHAIRVNAYSEGSFDEQMKLVADGLRRVVEYGAQNDISVIVENHGGYSSNGKWVVGVMKMVDHPRVGTLPDFGNFRIREGESYDSYRGVAEMMPYAKGVSVKPQVWDDQNNQSDIDLHRMMKIVVDSGWRGYAGIEHGPKGQELEGIRELRTQLLQVHDQLAQAG